MNGNGAKPNLIFVALIHRALRADGTRMRDAVATVDPDDRSGRLAGIRVFFDEYREQLVLHHGHEDELFFPALEARVGADAMRLADLTAQHEQLDAALQFASDLLATLADPTGDFATDRVEAVPVASQVRWKRLWAKAPCASYAAELTSGSAMTLE